MRRPWPTGGRGVSHQKQTNNLSKVKTICQLTRDGSFQYKDCCNLYYVFLCVVSHGCPTWPKRNGGIKLTFLHLYVVVLYCRVIRKIHMQWNQQVLRNVDELEAIM